MRRSEIRSIVSGHLACKGYSDQHYSWHAHKPILSLLVGTEIKEFRFATRDSKRTRERTLGSIPRRGPARPLPKYMMADHATVDSGRLELVDYINGCDGR